MGSNVVPSLKDASIIDAVQRHSRASLTQRNGSRWIVLHADFEACDPQRRNFDLRMLTFTDNVSGAPEAKDGEWVGVTFRKGHKKCLCNATVLNVAGDLVRLSWPDRFQQLQRRIFERTALLENHSLRLALSPSDGDNGGPQNSGPVIGGPRNGRTACPGKILDISAGGCRLTLPLSTELSLNEGDVLRCALEWSPSRPALSMDAIVRHVQPAAESGMREAGLQFVGLEATAQGQSDMLELARLVTSLQKETHRQTRRPRFG